MFLCMCVCVCVCVCVHVLQIIPKLYLVPLKAFCLVILFLMNYIYIELVLLKFKVYSELLFLPNFLEIRLFIFSSTCFS